MYVVVGCSECDHLWIVEDDRESTECRRCGSRHDLDARRHFAEAEDANTARELRSRILAQRASAGEHPTESFAELDDRVADGVIDPIHPVERTDPTPVPTDRLGLVTHGLERLERPRLEELVAFCAEYGQDGPAVERTLEALVRRGDVVREDRRYRLV